MLLWSNELRSRNITMSSYLEDVKRHGLPAIDSQRLHLAKVPLIFLLQFLNVTVFVSSFKR